MMNNEQGTPAHAAADGDAVAVEDQAARVRRLAKAARQRRRAEARRCSAQIEEAKADYAKRARLLPPLLPQ